MTVVFADNTALDEGRAEELAIVIPAFVGEAEKSEEDYGTKYRGPATDLCGDVEGAILPPNHLWEEIDATKVVVCIRPASPG